MNTVPLADVFEIGLDSNAANYAALTPLTYIERAPSAAAPADCRSPANNNNGGAVARRTLEEYSR